MATKYWVGSIATNGQYLWSTALNWTGGTVPAANDIVVFNNSVDCTINVSTNTVSEVNFSSWAGYLSGAGTLNVVGTVVFPSENATVAATKFINYTGTMYLTGVGNTYVLTNKFILACNITLNPPTGNTYTFDYLVTSGTVTVSRGNLKFNGKGTNSNGTFNASIGALVASSASTKSVECNDYATVPTRAIELTKPSVTYLLDLTTATATTLTFDIQNIYVTGAPTVNRYLIGNNVIQLENVYFRYTGTFQHGFITQACKVRNVYLGNTTGNFYTHSGSTFTNIYFESSTGNWTSSSASTGNINILGNITLTTANITTPGSKPAITFGAASLTFPVGSVCQFTSNGVVFDKNSLTGPFIVEGGYLTFMDAVPGNFISLGITSSYSSLIINAGTVELKENSLFYSISIGNGTLTTGANLITYYGKTLRLLNNDNAILTIGQYAQSVITIKCTLNYLYGITVAANKTLIINEQINTITQSNSVTKSWESMTINGTLNLLKGCKEDATVENGTITISSTGVLNVGKQVQYPFWQGNVGYSLGDVVIPTSIDNGYYYEATAITGSGISSDVEPNPWSTTSPVTDFQVTWTPKSLTTLPLGDIRFFDLTITGGKATFYNNIRSHRAITLSGGSATEFNTFAGKQLTSSFVAASVGLITNSVTGKTITIPADISNRKGITTNSGSNLLFTGNILKAGAITVNVNSTLTFTPPTASPDIIGSGDLICYGTLNINGNYTVQGAVNTFSTSGALAATWTNPGTTAYTLGTLKVPTVPNGFIYEVTTAGLGSSSEPGTNGTAPWPTTVGQTVQSNVAVFTCRRISVTITGNLSTYYFRIYKGGNFVNSDNKNIILGAGNVVHDIGNNNTTTLKGDVTCTGAFTNTSGNLIVNGTISTGAFTNTTGSVDIKGVATLSSTLDNSGTTTFRENVACSNAVTNTGALLDFKKDLIITTYSMSNTTGNFYVNGNLQVNQITNNSGNMILGGSVSDSSTTASFIGTIVNSVLTVTNITGTISIGDVLKNSYATSPGFPSTTITITGFLSGIGGIGTYYVSTAATFSLTTKTWLYTCNPNGKYLNINGNILHNDGVITINYEINPPLKRLESTIDSAYKLAKGTVNFNNNCYLYRFDAWNSNSTRVINIASGKTISLNMFAISPGGTFSGGAWAAYVTANLTVNALGSIIKITGLNNTAYGAWFHGGYNVTPVINTTDQIVTSYTRNTNINYGTVLFKVNSATGVNWGLLGSNVFENIIVDNLENPIAPAHNFFFENYVNVITNDFRINGNVTKKITLNTIYTDASTTGQTPPYTWSSTYTAPTGASQYYYLLKTNNNANNINVNNLSIYRSAVTPSAILGTPVWYASNSINNTITSYPNSGWTFVNQRYWVGGTGTWTTTDTSKWAATKGGTPGVSVPTSNEDVIFDDCPAPTWKKNTVYAIGSIVSPTYDNTVDPPTSNATGYYYYAYAGGTSASTEPSWPNTFNTTTPSANRFNDGGVTWETRRAVVTIATGAVGRTLTFKGDDDESHYRGSIIGTAGMSISGSVTIGDYAPGPTTNPADYTGLDFSGYTGTLTLIGNGSSELVTSGRQISFPLTFTLPSDDSVCVINEYFQTTPGTTVNINRGLVKFLGVSDTPSYEDENIYYNASIGFLVTSATTYRKLYFDNLELIGGATYGNHTFWDSTTSTSSTLEISADTQGITPTIYIAGILYTGGFKSIRANTTYAIPANVVFYGGAPTVGYCTAAARITNTIFKISNPNTNISLYNGSILPENYDFGTTYGNWNQVVGSGSLTLYKSLTLSPNMTCSNPLDLIINTGTSNVCNLITNGITFNGGITMTTGTLNFTEETTKIEFFTATSNVFTKVVNFYNGGTLELVGANATTPTWNFPNTITNLNLVNLSSLVIKFTNTASTALIFEGGDRSYGTVWFNRNATTATGLITIRGNNSFVYFKDGNEYDVNGNIITTLVNGLEVPVYSNIPAHTLAFTDGTTQQIQNFLVNGQAATTGGVSRKITLDNTGTGTTNFTLNNTNTTSDVFCYYLTVQNSTVTPYDINNPEDYHWTASASNPGTGANTGWQILDDRFWVGGTATAGYYLWSTAANWSLTPGGTGGAGAPAKLSNAYFTSHSSIPVTVTAGAKCYNLDCDNPDYGTYTGQFLGNHGSGVDGFGVYGNIRLCPNLIPSDGTGWTGQYWTLWGTNGKTNFIDYNGAVTRITSSILMGWVGSGSNVVTTYKLKSNAENVIGNFNLQKKTIFNTSPDGGATSYNVTCNTITSNASSPDTYIYLNKSKIYLTSSGNAWNFTGDPTVIDVGESEIILTYNTTSSAVSNYVRFYGGGKTYYDLTFLRQSGSKNPCYIGGDNTFHNINIVGGGQTNVYFEGANSLPSTTTITNILNIEGTSGNVVTIQSTSSGTTPQWNLIAAATAPIHVQNYVTVLNSNASTTPSKFYTGAGGSATNSPGWNTPVEGGKKQLLLLGVGQ